MTKSYSFLCKNRSQRRQELCSRYWFDCQCNACVKNWPLLAKLPKNSTIDLGLANKCLETGRAEKAVDAVKQYLNNDDDFSPSEEYIRAEDVMRRCINNQGTVVIANK